PLQRAPRRSSVSGLSLQRNRTFMELIKAGLISPLVVLDLLLRGKATIHGVEVIDQRVGSRRIVIGHDADTGYAIRVRTPSAVLLAALHDLAWLKEEELLVRAAFPQVARPFAGVILAADDFPPGFASLLPLFSFPCRFFRTLAFDNPSFPSIVF